MMALRSRPTILSDLTQEQAFESNTGILHSSSSYTHLTLHCVIANRYILPTFMQDRQEDGYGIICFTPFSSEAAWTYLYPKHPMSNTISVRLNDTTPPTFLSLTSLMSTSPTPETPPTHSSPSNQTVDPTTALITLMHQSLQQNAAMMVQIHSCKPPPTSLQP